MKTLQTLGKGWDLKGNQPTRPPPRYALMRRCGRYFPSIYMLPMILLQNPKRHCLHLTNIPANMQIVPQPQEHRRETPTSSPKDTTLPSVLRSTLRRLRGGRAHQALRPLEAQPMSPDSSNEQPLVNKCENELEEAGSPCDQRRIPPLQKTNPAIC